MSGFAGLWTLRSSFILAFEVENSLVKTRTYDKCQIPTLLKNHIVYLSVYKGLRTVMFYSLLF